MCAKTLPPLAAKLALSDGDEASVSEQASQTSSAPDVQAGEPLYRLFCTRETGEIERLFSFTASDPAQAVAEAERRRANRPAELWCRGRRVKLFAGSALRPLGAGDVR